MRWLAGGVLVLFVLSGCRPDTVAVTFRPKVGSTYRYEVDVTADTTTTLEGLAPDHKVDHVQLVEEQTVLAADASGVQVRVLVGQPGSVAQAFVVRFDRSAQLVSIDAAEDASADLTGALGVPEIFPGAAAAPDRRVGPGVHWSTTRRVRIPGATGTTTVHSKGHLLDFGVDGNAKVARLASTTTLPLRSRDGQLQLVGTASIAQRVAYDLADGAVHQASATTTGTFHVTVQPPAGTNARPVPGTLVARVRSTTRRL